MTRRPPREEPEELEEPEALRAEDPELEPEALRVLLPLPLLLERLPVPPLVLEPRPALRPPPDALRPLLELGPPLALIPPRPLLLPLPLRFAILALR
jgi:hypothetical protein